MDIQGRMENNSQAVLWDSEILYEYSDIWYGSSHFTVQLHGYW